MPVPQKPIEAIFFRDFKHAHIPEILDEIYSKGIYHLFLVGSREKIIVDIGANIGLFSYYAKDYAKMVYAVEPAKDHQEILQKMIEFNKIKNITVCPNAISNKTERVKFFHNMNTTAHSMSLNSNPNDYEEVQALSFNDFMENNKIDHVDLLKLDPEGEEGKIVTSGGFAKWAPRVKVIVGEWHQWSNMEKSQFANVLIDLGYKFNWIAGTNAAVYNAVRL